jgi:hypothetical protein
MTKDLEGRVKRRARYRCEYCRLPQSVSLLRHQVDHVVARQHRGETTEENLALCCVHGNLHKGPNLAGLDPPTGELVGLYHPRRHRWREHFAWQGPLLVGLTPIGRVTVHVLCINDPHVVAARAALIEEGVFPPKP